MAGEAALARRVIDTRVVPRRDRAELWRTVSAPQFELTGLPVEPCAHGVAYGLGPVTLTRSSHPRQTLVRTASRARADGVEDIFCSMELSGGFGSVVGDAHGVVGVGEVSLWDLGQAAVKHCGEGETLCLRIDRDAWRRAAGEAVEVHGITLGPMAGLVRDHLLSLERMLSADAGLASPALGEATVQLLAACLQPSQTRPTDEAVDAQVSALRLHRAERYIRAHLDDPELSPDRIAKAIGVSRSSLYGLFERCGGVAARVRGLRLELAHAMLSGAGDRRIADIAEAVGFSGPSQFNRAFKAQYAVAPGDLRRAR